MVTVNEKTKKIFAVRFIFLEYCYLPLKLLCIVIGQLVLLLSLTDVVHANSINGTVSAPAKVKKVLLYLQPGADNNYQPNTQTHEISQKGVKFKPPFITVVEGDELLWLNDEEKNIDHNVFSLSELKSFDLGLGAPGSTLNTTFPKLGVINYYCSVHKTMEGKIVVLPSRYFLLLDKPGDFSFHDIPEGNWQLKALVFNRRYKAVPANLLISPQTSERQVILNIVKK